MNQHIAKCLLVGCMCALLAGCSLFGISPKKRVEIQLQVEKYLADLDRNEENIDNSEYVRRLYRHFKERLPTEEETKNVVGFLEGDVEEHVDPNGNIHQCLVQLTRSEVYLHFLAEYVGRKAGFDYRWLKDNTKLFTEFEVSTELPDGLSPYSAEELESDLLPYTPPLRSNKTEEGEAYSNFFGNVHGHTIFSDGMGTPQQAYEKAREDGLDFFATSEHAVQLSLLPWGNTWWLSRVITDLYNDPGNFVTLYVYEWSSVIYGHINVIGTEDLSTSFASDTYTPEKLYAWLQDREEAVGRFNHPARTSPFTFEHFEFDRPNGKRNMVGIEVFNKDKNIQNHLHHTGFDSDPESNHFEEALNLGWDLGIAGGQDDHQAQWGALKHAVTGIWATELTRAGIYDAYRNRRTYATEDRNLSLSFKVDGNEMGSRLPVPTSGSAQAVIRVIDPDGLSRKIELYRNGVKIQEAPPPTVDPNDATVTWTLNPNAGDYYYVVTVDSVPEYAVSSPIWFQ